jgi:hypothetical protein
METCQRSAEEIAKYGPLTEEQMKRRANVRGLLALVSTTNDGKKRMEFVNRDFNAAINIRRCPVLENRPPELTRENFVGQPLKVELYEKNLEAVVGGRSEKTGRRLHVSWRRFVNEKDVAARRAHTHECVTSRTHTHECAHTSTNSRAHARIRARTHECVTSRAWSTFSRSSITKGPLNPL